MAELESGLYETIVTASLQRELTKFVAARAHTRMLRVGDVTDRIGRHVAALIEQVLSDFPENERVSRGVLLANELANKIAESVGHESIDPVIQPAQVLAAVLELNPDGTPHTLADPLVPLLDTVLLTNAPGEPTLWNQLIVEIDSADRIDVVMAFIRRSGIVPLLPALRRHCEAGKNLRILTTTYTNSTEQRALDQ